MRTILSIYMVDFLGFSETVGASLYHGFAALCYFTPVIGAIIADSFLGNIFSRSVEPYFLVITFDKCKTKKYCNLLLKRGSICF